MDYDLLSKYLAGDTTPEERVEVYNWIKQSKENEYYFNSLRKIEDYTIWNKKDASKKYKGIRGSLFIIVAQVAAIFVLFWSTYTIVNMIINNQDESETFLSQNLVSHTAAPGEYLEISLIDGTRVWLNSKSSLTYDSLFSNNQRVVELEGEAFFDVAKNKEMPFKVKVENHVVIVTGTEFNVSSYNYFETSLVSGSVTVENLNNGNKIDLKPLEKVREINNNFIVSAIDDNDFLWRKGVLSINDKTIDEIIPILERYYEVEFIYDAKSFNKNKKYTGKFRISDGVEQILMILQIHDDISYTMDEEKITLN